MEKSDIFIISLINIIPIIKEFFAPVKYSILEYE